MSLKTVHMLSTSRLRAAPPPSAYAPIHLLARESVLSPKNGDEWSKPDVQVSVKPRRTRIWEFGTNLHCSIIGTCLSTAELRHVLQKLRSPGAALASDHDLHCAAVTMASQREGGAKFLQKTLDRRHHAAIVRCSPAMGPAELLAYWGECLKQGDIPGAYWAVLTHPQTTDEVVRRVFGDVHMLSHLVGAANRADIRRLRQLEEENAALALKIARQQQQLRVGFVARDRTISQLHEIIARQSSERPQRSPDQNRDEAATESIVGDIGARLARETARRTRSEERAKQLAARLKSCEQLLDTVQQQSKTYRGELDVAERQLATLLQPEARQSVASIDLSGATLLYVGGRANLVPALKNMIEHLGARFLHHDGGIEDSSGLLPGFISRADRVFFPVDCVSHQAVAAIKSCCRQMGKTYEPLRTASLTCLVSALMEVAAADAAVAAK